MSKTSKKRKIETSKNPKIERRNEGTKEANERKRKTNERTKERRNESERTNERTKERKRTKERTKERKRTNERTNEGTKERKRRNEGTKERRNEGTNERRNERTNERMSSTTFLFFPFLSFPLNAQIYPFPGLPQITHCHTHLITRIPGYRYHRFLQHGADLIDRSIWRVTD